MVALSMGPGVKLITTVSTAAPRRPLGLTAADDAVERQWTSKLLNDLQGTAGDASVSATISELRATIEARDQARDSSRQLKKHEEPASTGGVVKGASANTRALSLEVPHYDAHSIDELQKAARSAAIPNEAKAPMPQLLRDMSDALSRQKEV